MKRLPWLAVLFVSGTFVIAGGPSVLSRSGKADGKQFDFDMSEALVKSTPSWTPDTPSPPLAPGRAIAIATKQLSELVKDPGKWTLHQLSLADFGDHSHWVYVAVFDRQGQSALQGGDYLHIPVLMSGATIKPKIRPL